MIHMASPLAKGIVKEEIFGPAVRGTTEIMREASRVGSVRKVVVTSSIAAFIPMSGIPEGGVVKGISLSQISTALAKSSCGLYSQEDGTDL